MFQDPSQGQRRSGQNPTPGQSFPQHPSSQNLYNAAQGLLGLPANPGSAAPTPSGSPLLSHKFPYQQSGGGAPPLAPAVPPPLSQALAQLPRQYLRVFTRLSAATFTQEMGQASWGRVWIQLVGFALFSGLLFALLALLDLIVRGTTLSTLSLSFGVFAVALITFLFVVAFFFLHTSLLYLFAKRVGGQGTFLAQCSSTLLFLVPSGVIAEVLTFFTGFIPVLGWLFLLAWLIYIIVLDILVIKAVHRLSSGKASAVVLLLPLVFLVVAGKSASSLAGETQADPYSLTGEIVGLFGVAFLVTMLILSWMQRASGSKPFGRRIMATVTRVDWQAPMGPPASNPANGAYIVTAVGTDPQTQRTYLFWQRFGRPPRCTQGSPVSIILDSGNPGRYYMEL
jgi:hypothetical protein